MRGPGGEGLPHGKVRRLRRGRGVPFQGAHGEAGAQGINWDQMPGGLGGFLAMRITVKNLLISVIFLMGGAAAFHIFGLTKPAPHAPVPEVQKFREEARTRDNRRLSPALRRRRPAQAAPD